MVQRLSFQTELLLSFVLVIVLATGLGYLFARGALEEAFEDFARRSASQQARETLPWLANQLASYYEHLGSWQGLPQIIKGAVGDRYRKLTFMLADQDGTVIVAGDEHRVGQKLSEDELQAGVPIVVKGRTVGTLVGLPLRELPLAQEYAQAVRNALWLAGWAAGAVALLLGFVLRRQLMAPLRELSKATQQIAQCKLNERVPEGRGELGELARSFNRMAAALEQARQAQRHMIADVAHELRTPISIVQAGLEGLIDGLLAPVPENFAALHNKILLVNRLVTDLQQLALADAGQLSLQKEACDLRQLLQHIQATIGAQLEEQKIRLVMELPTDPPLVKADVQRIEQVLLNLLSNAARHTPEGGTIHIKVQVGRSVQVSVCDSGPGLSPEDLEHMFERFYRADRSRSRRSGGSGLGLAIAKALVEAHGGRIWAENAPGGGACFHFTLAPCDR